MEITFPLEFTVQGTPVSLQTKRREARLAWRERVRQASNRVLPLDHYATDASLAVTLFYFPDSKMQGDIDNIVKPVLDAMCRHVYLDDRQVERIWVRKFEPDRLFEIPRPSVALARAVEQRKPVLYIRLGDDLTEGLV